MTSVDISKLPRRTLKAGTELCRIHRAHLNAWFFDNSPHDRFNPTGTPGRGACYWAHKPLGAWVESFRRVMTWTTDDIAARALSTITLTEELAVRDLTVKRALRAGVTVAITGGREYDPAHALADGLQSVSEGARYRVGHDLSGKLIAIAWFGDAGAVADAAHAGLPVPRTTQIPGTLVEEACRLFGYKILPSPV